MKDFWEERHEFILVTIESMPSPILNQCKIIGFLYKYLSKFIKNIGNKILENMFKKQRKEIEKDE